MHFDLEFTMQTSPASGVLNYTEDAISTVVPTVNNKVGKRTSQLDAVE